MIVALLAGYLFALDNREFFDTVAEQVGTYDWHQIECREATPGLPALVLETPTGKRLVCNKLK